MYQLMNDRQLRPLLEAMRFFYQRETSRGFQPLLLAATFTEQFFNTQGDKFLFPWVDTFFIFKGAESVNYCIVFDCCFQNLIYFQVPK